MSGAVREGNTISIGQILRQYLHRQSRCWLGWVGHGVAGIWGSTNGYGGDIEQSEDHSVVNNRDSVPEEDALGQGP